MSRRYERGRTYLEGIKLQMGCQLCGEREVAALDFHHRNETEKDFNLSGIANSKPLDALRREVEKCVILCASCHRKVHAGILTLPTNGEPDEPDEPTD